MAAQSGDAHANSVDYWNKRFAGDWVIEGGRRQTAFFAGLCCRELPAWLIADVRGRALSIFDYGCAVGDALPILQQLFPGSTISGGDVSPVAIDMARALYPDFRFADLNLVDRGARLADVIYCSNTLEHLTEWRQTLVRLAEHAGSYVLLLVPFEEEEPIAEHAATFEFDSLPPQLRPGMRLLHLGVVDAEREPETQWHGRQLIAIYGNGKRGTDMSESSQPLPGANDRGRVVLDMSAIRPAAIPALLAKFAALSGENRRLTAAAQHSVRRLRGEQSRLAASIELARGVEAAQRYLLDHFDRLEPGLLEKSGIPPLPDNDSTAAQPVMARLTDAINRANKLGLLFADSFVAWRDETASLRRRLAEAGRALEAAIDERDRLRPPAAAAPALAPAAGGRTEPLVSIVLPVYNQSCLIDEAVAGVLSQTYSRWELIVVDDGSDDDVERRVRRYRGDRRILFLRQPNQRLPAALNHGFAIASGELLTWTSADNIMLPDQLALLVAELAAHPEAGLVYSDYWAIDEYGAPLDDPRWRPHNRDLDIPGLIRLPAEATIDNLHRSGDNFIGPSFLYRRAVADLVGHYADDAFGGEDYDYWLRMHLVTEFRHIRAPLYKYRVHTNTLTSRAEALGLYANIRELLATDHWRLDTLLRTGSLERGDTALRPTGQFHPAILKRCKPVAYSDVAKGCHNTSAEERIAVDIDVPARAVDAAALRETAILLCRSGLTAALLRREPWTEGKRILLWDGKPTAELQHAFVQACAEQASQPVVPPPRTPAQLDAAFRPRRILLLVDRWSAGGLENIAIDLADRLAAGGCSVTVASADGPAPTASFADAAIRTVSFGGDEGALDGFLGREGIEVVNYHHSRFAVARARERGVATVYTMQNSYLWMNERDRRAAAAGLAGMDRLIAVSRQVAQFAVTQFGVPAERIVVVPNALRDELIARGPAPARAPSPFLVLMVASFTRLKLQHVAIAAFADVAGEIPDMRLRLIGSTAEAAYLAELREQIDAASLGDRIDVAVGLSRQETIGAMASAQVMVLPSLVEGCSVALLEAAAVGCVCIASDVGDARALALPEGPVVLLPSPLGELEQIGQQQFVAAAMGELPQHRRNLERALRRVWRDYDLHAAGIAEGQALLRERHGMQRMTEAYLAAYTMAYRGAGRGCEAMADAQRRAALSM
ncbi:MAG TPA: glycosyltransferase [Stellaceae bacterium]|nr:glycosyltransferase [Stellaceae bacterium]